MKVVSIQIQEAQNSDVPLFSKRPHPIIILIVYDTALIQKRQQEDVVTNWYVPAKYCAAIEDGWTDSGIFAQVHAYAKEYTKACVWFDCLRDLPAAIKRLKRKHPGKGLPSQVDGVIDFPLRRDAVKPGSTIVRPRFPKQKPIPD